MTDPGQDRTSEVREARTTDGQETLSRLLHGAEQRLRSAWAEADSIRHRPTKGRAREHPVRMFLEGQLPDRFGFLSGEGIDVFGNRTPQLDLIVYDRMRVGPFFAAGEDGLIPAEAILATIEVKSILTREAMSQFAASVAAIHSLRPHQNPFVFARTGGAEDDGQPRVQSTLFAYESDLGSERWAMTELERARECIVENDSPIQGVDRIVVLDRGMILPAEGQALVDTEETGVLRTWFFHFVSYLTREAERRRRFPWSAYADPTDEDSRVQLAEPLAPGRSDPPSKQASERTQEHRKGGPRTRRRRFRRDGRD
jgi:hypothetical protein